MAGKSLASQAGALSAAPTLTLPAVFSAPQEAVEGRYIPPYVVFCHNKRADEWKRLVNKFGNVNEGDMYLIMHKELHRLDPGKMGILVAKQYWAKVTQTGEMLTASWTDDKTKEHIEAVVLVYLEDRIVPANVNFRSTKCGAGKTLADALLEAGKPDWADRSPAHRETLICQQEFMRFYGLVSVLPSRTGKGGNVYRPTSTDIKPTSVVEWRLLDALTKDPATKKLLDDAAERYQYRLAEVAKKIVAK